MIASTVLLAVVASDDWIMLTAFSILSKLIFEKAVGYTSSTKFNFDSIIFLFEIVFQSSRTFVCSTSLNVTSFCLFFEIFLIFSVIFFDKFVFELIIAELTAVNESMLRSFSLFMLLFIFIFFKTISFSTSFKDCLINSF